VLEREVVVEAPLLARGLLRGRPSARTPANGSTLDVMYEEELIGHLVRYFRVGGCRVATEVPIWSKTCDVYALCPDGTSIAVEAKAKDWRRAVAQAICYDFGADFAYTALPLKVAQRAAAARQEAEQWIRLQRWPNVHGLAVGILGVTDAGEVTELIPARRSTLCQARCGELALKNINYQEEHGLLPMKRFPPRH